MDNKHTITKSLKVYQLIINIKEIKDIVEGGNND